MFSNEMLQNSVMQCHIVSRFLCFLEGLEEGKGWLMTLVVRPRKAEKPIPAQIMR